MNSYKLDINHSYKTQQEKILKTTTKLLNGLKSAEMLLTNTGRVYCGLLAAIGGPMPAYAAPPSLDNGSNLALSIINLSLSSL